MTTTYYRIWNAASGADLGAFPGDTEEDAIRAMLADAGCDDEPSDDLRAEETEPMCAACSEDVTAADAGRAGTVEGLYTDITLCSDCASYTLDELGIDEDANEAETQDEYIAKVAAERAPEAS